MKGITPVITTVLLLLMAVAAVGGAWVWYQRMQTSSMAGGTGQVENIKKTTVSVSADKLACSSTAGHIDLTVANVGSESTTLTNLTLSDSSGNVKAFNAGPTIGADSLSTIDMANLTTLTCSSGTTYYVDARIGAQYVIRDYPITTE